MGRAGDLFSAFAAAAALLALAACAGVAPEVETDVGLGHELTAAWVSSLTIEPDIDEGEPEEGRELEGDFADGEGWSARGSIGAIGDEAVRGEVGVTFVRTNHIDRSTGTEVDFYLAHVDLLARARIGWDSFAIRPGAGFGGGGALIDFHRGYDDDGGLSGSIIGLLGVELFGHALFELRGEVFGFGYPGETIADGWYVALGGGLRF